jgi:hypothetical protein
VAVDIFLTAGFHMHDAADPAWRHIKALRGLGDIGTPGITRWAGRRIVAARIVLIFDRLLCRGEVGMMPGAGRQQAQQQKCEPGSKAPCRRRGDGGRRTREDGGPMARRITMAEKARAGHISWSIRRGHISLRRGAASRPLSHDGGNAVVSKGCLILLVRNLP